jgi:hypothetical protein
MAIQPNWYIIFDIPLISGSDKMLKDFKMDELRILRHRRNRQRKPGSPAR